MKNNPPKNLKPALRVYFDLEPNRHYHLSELRELLRTLYPQNIDNKSLSNAQNLLCKKLERTNEFKYIRYDVNKL